jgi:phosphoglycolate phosphatase-like HAD superfamily hydrolase
MFDAVLFDFDDSLVDTQASRIPAIIEYCRSVHGVEVSSEEVLHAWGLPFNALMQSLIGSASLSIDQYLDICKRYPLRPFPESVHALQSLSGRSRIGIVTSVAKSILVHSLDSLGWTRGWFSVLLGHDDTKFYKPDPRVFDSGLELLSISPERRKHVLYVGDSLIDAHAAHGAGLSFLGIARDKVRQNAFSMNNSAWRENLNDVSTWVHHAPSVKVA